MKKFCQPCKDTGVKHISKKVIDGISLCKSCVKVISEIRREAEGKAVQS